MVTGGYTYYHIWQAARAALKAQGLARYETISDAEIAQQKAEAESARIYL